MFLKTQKLVTGYRKQTIQSGLNLHIQSGEMVCLLGANGCGKSTLLRTLCGLQPALGGEIFINEQNFEEISNTEKAHLISFVLTDKVSIEHFSVFELVFTGRYPHTSWLGNRTAEDIEKTENALQAVRLTHKRDCFVDELSDGERQRAMIAKALAQDTPFVFLDEPTAHLDLPNRTQIMRLLKRLTKETNKTIVLSTHELDLALQTADRLWLMTSEGIIEGQPNDDMLQAKIAEVFQL